MRTFIFAKRNILEALRDPVSYIFTLVMPILMLVIFYISYSFVPEQSTEYNLFSLASNLSGILVFSYAFVAVYLSVLLSKDKTTAFLKRLFVSPLKRYEFIFGYGILGLIMALLQTIFGILTAFILGWCSGMAAFANVGFCLLLPFLNLPVICFYISAGLLIGTLFSEKAAPPITSTLSSVAGFLSGAWMPVEIMGNGFTIFCKVLPFYPATQINRTLLVSHIFDFSNFYLPILTTILYAVAFATATIYAFKIYVKK